MCIKTKIQLNISIYNQHISYHAQNKKKTEENNMSTTKTYQMPNK